MKLKNFWQILFGIFFGTFGLCWTAFGATYNFYLNNTEQGDHGVANPVVTVSDAKASGTGAQTSSGSPAVPAAAPSSVPAPPAAEPAIVPEPVPVSKTSPAAGSNVASVALPEPERHHEFRRFKFSTSGAMVMPEVKVHATGADGPGYSYPPYDYTTRVKNGGGILSAGFYVSRDLGINAFVGAAREVKVFAGGELELLPIHISIGRLEDLVDAGILLGASTIGRSDYNWVTAHGGARIDFNLARNWGVSAVGRGNGGYLMAEAGLLVRL